MTDHISPRVQHQNVTQTIEKLISENSLVKSMFIRSYYDTERGRGRKGATQTNQRCLGVG